MAAAASPQPPPSTRCTSSSRPPLSRGQALAASSAHSCECSSGRSSDHVCECRNPQPDRTPPDEQPSQQRQLAKSGILRTPPEFCASAKWLPSQSASAVAAATAILRERLITAPPGRQLDRIFVAARGFPPTSGGVKRLSRR